MNEPPVPGVGDFGVVTRGSCPRVTLSADKQLGPMALALRKEICSKIKARGHVESAGSPPDHGRSEIFMVVPSHLQVRGKRYRAELRRLEHDIWRAIRSFVRKQKQRLRHTLSGRKRKERTPFRRPVPAMVRARASYAHH